MEIKKLIFKRPPRIKKIKLKDGSTKEIELAEGWFYRLQYVDGTGKNRTVERGPFRKRVAQDRCSEKFNELSQTDGNIRDGEKMTFDDLAAICEAEIYAGRKSNSTQYIIRTLQTFFGTRKLAEIDRGLLHAYIQHRTAQSIRTAKNEDLKRTVKRSTVDKELRIMRSMIKHAIDEGWILKDPFKVSKKLVPLITKAVGNRDRTLKVDEEFRLLDACEPKERIIAYTRMRKAKGSDDEKIKCNDTLQRETGNEWLKAFVLLGLDGGMRRGEILQLKWSDVDFDAGVIALPGSYTKSKKSRLAPISERMAVELERIKTFSEGEKVFPYSFMTRSFNTAVRLAGIDDLTFHDLRRTYTTRHVAHGENLGLIAKSTGHQDLKILMEHYAKTGAREMRQVAETTDAINRMNRENYESEFIN
ncbi:MAG: tyrosine-type recombinase/integrase [Pyrinomonadaceae bacterium]